MPTSHQRPKEPKTSRRTRAAPRRTEGIAPDTGRTEGIRPDMVWREAGSACVRSLEPRGRSAAGRGSRRKVGAAEAAEAAAGANKMALHQTHNTRTHKKK